MNEMSHQASPQKRFDEAASRIQSVANEEVMGSFSRLLDMGQVAVCFLAFIPREGQSTDYVPSILFQDLVEGHGHNGRYWKQTSKIYVRRDGLETDNSAQQLADIETKLNTFKEFIDSGVEIAT